MVPNFKLDIQETPRGDLMIKELRDPDMVIPFDSSVSITIVKRVTSIEETVVKAFVHDHRNEDVINKFHIKFDGRYVVTHAVVPTTLSGDYPTQIVYQDGKLQKAVGGSLSPVDIDIFDTDLSDSNVQVMKKEAFVLYNLWQCYLNYCKKLFENECSKDTQCDDCNDELTANRNLLWIFLNTIQYLMQLGHPERAQDLLESITGGCNTLCSNEMFSKQYNCGCGK